MKSLTEKRFLRGVSYSLTSTRDKVHIGVCPSLFGIVKFCKIELNKVATGRFTVELNYFRFSVE